MADFSGMSTEHASALLLAAGLHLSATRLGSPPDALRGKNLALLCDAQITAEFGANLFRLSAATLGARVSHLRPNLNEHSSSEQVQHIAAMLGRLYDGIECLEMSTDLVRRIGADAGVPVFEAISSDAHPLCALASRLPDDRTLGDRRCAILQAVLIATLT